MIHFSLNCHGKLLHGMRHPGKWFKRGNIVNKAARLMKRKMKKHLKLRKPDFKQFKDQMVRIKKCFHTKVSCKDLEKSNNVTKEEIEKFKGKMVQVINYNMVLDIALRTNEKIHHTIGIFHGHFIAKIDKKDIPKVISEFMIRLLAIQKKHIVIKQMYEQAQKEIENVKNGHKDLESIHQAHEKELFLTKDEIKEFHQISDSIQVVLEELFKKYEVPDAEQTSEKEQTPQQKEQIQKMAENVDKLKNKMTELEKNLEQNKKILDKLFSNQKKILDLKNIQLKQIEDLQILQKGINEVQRQHNDDTLQALNDLKRIKPQFETIPVLSDIQQPLKELENGLRLVTQ